jgi:16S rRNA (guanine966-N2)-methyltransferase
MTSRVKASLFDILMPHLHNASVLDLFAGTGQLGIEALSRGASHCTFVERDKNVIAVTRKNILTTKVESQSTVLHQDVLRFLKQAGNQSFDMILISPPQYQGLVSSTLEALDSHRQVNSNTIIAIQQSSKESHPSNLQYLKISGLRTYGSTDLLFYGASKD